MLIAFSIDGDNENAIMDSRFGRCSFYALFDDQSGDIDYMINSAAGAATGAGIVAAQELIDRGVKAVVSGQVGPYAMEVLKAAMVSFFPVPADLQFSTALRQYRQGQLHQYKVQQF